MNIFLTNYNKIKIAILVLLVASLPFYLEISNVLIGVGAFFTLLHAFMTTRWSALKIDRLVIAFLAYFTLDVIGLLYTESENLSTGLFTLDKHQALVLVPLIFADLTIDRKQRQVLLSVFVGTCFVASLICLGVVMYESITEYDKVLHEWLSTHDRLADPINMHAVYLALYLSLAVFIILDSLKNNYRRFSWMKIALMTLLVFYLLAFITALGARTAIAGLMLIIITNIIIYSREQRSYKLYIFAAIMPLLVAGFIWINPVVRIRFMDMLKSSYENSNYGSYFARTHIWVPGLEAIHENLLIGVGTGDHQTELNKKYLKYNFTEGVRLEFNMHSQYLQTALNFGLVGLVVLLGNFYTQVRQGLRRRDFLYLSFIALFMLACVTEATLVLNKGTVFFVVLSFIFYKSKADDRDLRQVES